jgi:UDP-N-acetylglucosamine 2-epimerase
MLCLHSQKISMKLCFILGTRPEIIKTAPIIFAAREAGVEFALVHSGQHYDARMDDVFGTVCLNPTWPSAVEGHVLSRLIS